VSVLPWILALAGLAGLLFGFRSLRRLFSESAQRSARDRRAVESRAERDRRDCRALEMSMRDRSPDLTPEGVDAKPPLRRRSTQAPHGFDPTCPSPSAKKPLECDPGRPDAGDGPSAGRVAVRARRQFFSSGSARPRAFLR